MPISCCKALRADTRKINGLQTLTNHSTQHGRNTAVHFPFLRGTGWRRFDGAMPIDAFIREKFTRESSTARRAVREYFKRYPKEQFQTELESWRYLPSQTIEFIMKRLREPVEAGG